jgi:hypothetical protein
MPLEGYGMFLSKPYRLADVDYCFQKVLATARIPAGETGRAMTADLSRKANPAPGEAQPSSVHPNEPPASDKDDVSKSSIGELQRRFAERAARQRAVDPAAAKAARRAALEAYECTRARRRRLVLGLAGGAIACSSIIYLAPMVGSRAGAPSPRAALPEPALLVSIAVATPIPALPDPTSPSTSPSPAINVAYTSPLVPAAKQEAPAAESQQALGEMALNEVPLQRDEAKEVQARLRSFGFNPGPVDGDPGAITEGAIRRYQQNRRQPQTGKVDRELLEQLRHDPAPKIVQRTAGPYARPTPSPAPRRPSPFESVRAAGDRLGQWLDSRLR